MLYKNQSTLTGNFHTLEIPLTEAEYLAGIVLYNQGNLIQNCFPRLSAEHREFLLTGITPSEWEMLGEEE